MFELANIESPAPLMPFPRPQDSKRADAVAVMAVFHQCFYAQYRTRLIAGGDEPYYRPASDDGDDHRILFREDFVASALHEAAHWCVAGPERRRLADYGYWYAADGRSAEQQRAFEAVECYPQALEWLFSRAAGLPFRISIDNLDGEAVEPFPFALAVWQRLQRLCRAGLPARAECFRAALADHYGGPRQVEAGEYSLAELLRR